MKPPLPIDEIADPQATMPLELPVQPPRSAWVEIDLAALARNFRVIRAHVPARTRLLYVVKDDAYGQGAAVVSRTALANGAESLAVYTIQEGVELRQAGITAPILILGERLPEEFRQTKLEAVKFVPLLGGTS